MLEMHSLARLMQGMDSRNSATKKEMTSRMAIATDHSMITLTVAIKISFWL